MRYVRCAMMSVLAACGSGRDAAPAGSPEDAGSAVETDEGEIGTETTAAETSGGPDADLPGGFARNAASISLPALFGMDEFDTLAASVTCDTGFQFTHMVSDLDGDAIADLVVTDRCDEEGVGTEHWLVFRGTGTGFEAQAEWRLPAMLEPEQWRRPAVSDTCSNGEEYTHLTTDLDGDARPDLVVTDACDALEVGTSNWLLYRGGDGGFAGEPTSFTLPEIFGSEEFQTAAGSVTCDGGERFTHDLLDLNGDGRPDLVVTDRCDRLGVGTDTWLVFEGGEGGFAPFATEWELPSLFGADEFDRSARSDDCDGGGRFGLALVDLDGDGAPDLVVTDNCDEAATGSSHWRVAFNDGDGFGPTWEQWSLPHIFGQDEFEAVAGSFACDGGERFTYQLADLEGDGPPELVVTDRCDTAAVGSAMWLVFDNEGAGFAAPAREWSLPELFEMDEFDALANSVKCDGGEAFTHGLLDLDGDARLDLVVADACDAAGVGSTHWNAFLGQP